MKHLVFICVLLPFQLFAQSWEYLGGTDISHNGVKMYSITLAQDGTPYVFYNRLEEDTDYSKFFVRKWKNNQWETLANPSFDIHHDYNCHNRIKVIDDQNVYVLFRQYKINSIDVCTRVMKFDGSQWNYLGDSLLIPDNVNTNLLMLQQKPVIPYYESDSLRVLIFDGTEWVKESHEIAQSTGETYLISSEVKDDKIYFLLLNEGVYQVYTFANNQWSLFASISHPITDKIPYELGQIKINNQDEVFVHLYLLNTSQSYVFKLTQGVASTLGNGSLIDSPTGYSYMNLDKNGLPIIAFKDQAFYNELSVMHFDGNNWNFIGDRGFTTGKRSDVMGIEVDNNNIPYVATAKKITFDGYVNVLRLKQPISVKESTKTASFEVFPNPAKDNVSIQMPKNFTISSLSLFDMNGKLVKNMLIDNQQNQNISIQDLVSGTYLLQVNTIQGEMMYQKIVKY